MQLLAMVEERPAKKARAASLDELLTIHEDDPASSFDTIMETLLNRCVLRIGDSHRYRFLELEMYCRDRKVHNDPFTHGDPMQERKLTWYFHKTGNGYKGGTYKGLDLALGRPGRPVGVLVRSIVPCDDADGDVVCGSCLCVDRILKLASSPDIASFVSNYGTRVDVNEGLRVELNDDGVNTLPLVRSARVGLSMKTKTTEADATWWGKKYRYMTTTKLKKGKNLIVCAMIEGQNDPKGVTTKRAIDKYRQAYSDGKSKKVKSFLGKSLSTVEECEFLGAISSAPC
uniref:Uncharacterized protein n=1 Tax=Odontella aurita TaxID=265563 RepID=A0A7S4JSM8_9STRA|mmetsp:Transcript_53377/g.159799  ORF Transcript_53377/g.159799 Transcript_53377/m.159799 type:complete len:286 (+) Transcript_53377:138-995(+)